MRSAHSCVFLLSSKPCSTCEDLRRLKARTEAALRNAVKALDSAAVFQALTERRGDRRCRGRPLKNKIKSLRINKYRYRFDAPEFSSKLG